MEPVTGSALLAAGVTAATAAGNAVNVAKTNKRGEKLTKWLNEQNQKFAREQNQWNLDMWNKQNEYNSPSSIVNRLKEAGLNPLFYNMDGTSNAGALTSVDLANQSNQGFSYQTPQFDASGLSEALQNYSNNKLAVKQLNIKEKELDAYLYKNDADVRKINSEIENLVKDGKLKEEQANLVKAQVEETFNKISNINANTELLGAQKEKVLNDIKNDNALTEKQIKKLEAETKLDYKTIEKIGEDIKTQIIERAIKGEELSLKSLEVDIARACKEADINLRITESEVASAESEARKATARAEERYQMERESNVEVEYWIDTAADPIIKIIDTVLSFINLRTLIMGKQEASRASAAANAAAKDARETRKVLFQQKAGGQSWSNPSK